MKRIFSVLLVAALTVSTVFAAFSGSASIGFGGNFDNGNFGFIDNGANVKFDVDLATASAEKIAEGDVYASIKATLALKLYNGEKGGAAGDLYKDNWKIRPIADITEAKVAGENWYVSILGIPNAPNFAESAIDTYTVKKGYDKYGLHREDFDKNANYGLAFNKTTGIEAMYADYVVGFGLLGDYSSADTWKLEDNLNVAAYFATPEYNFNNLVFKTGAVYSYNTIEKFNDKNVPVHADKTAHNLGLSAKVGYETDLMSASVATDLGFDFTKKIDEKGVVGADVAASFKYDFLTADVYYATKAVTGETPTPDFDKDPTKTAKSYFENLLSAQVKTDLNSFNVPVVVTAGVKDIIAKQAIFAKAEVTPVEGLKVTAKGGYTVDADGRADNGTILENNKLIGSWNAGAEVEYAFDLFTVKAGTSVEQELDAAKNVKLGASASIATEALIPGAELKLAWADADDLLDKFKDETNYGKITASCKIEF